MQSYQQDVLQTYAGLWNAFECIVNAIAVLVPMPTLSPSEKARLITSQLSGKTSISTGDIDYCYKEFVNPGFRAKAAHALSVCFSPSVANCYLRECFELSERSSRLYDIRNAINHGEIDAENPDELGRIAGRLEVLRIIVLQLFSFFIPTLRIPSLPKRCLVDSGPEGLAAATETGEER